MFSTHGTEVETPVSLSTFRKYKPQACLFRSMLIPISDLY